MILFSIISVLFIAALCYRGWRHELEHDYLIGQIEKLEHRVYDLEKPNLPH